MRHPRRTPRAHVPARTRVPARHVTYARAVELHQHAMEAAGRGKGLRDAYALVCRRYLEFITDTKRADASPPTLGCLTLEHARAFLVHLRTATTRDTLTGRERTVGTTAIRWHALALKAFARFCHEEGLTATSRLAQLKLPKATQQIVDIFTPAHVQALFALAARHPQRERNLAMLAFLLDTGVRASELCDLTTDNLFTKTHTARVHGKGDKWRTVFFSATTAKLLVRYLAVRPTSEHPQVFLSMYGRPYARGSLLTLIHRLGEKAGISGEVRCSPHTFRHTFATRFLVANPNAIFQLQELLGHSSLDMTRRYVKLAQGQERAPGPSAVEQYGIGKLLG